ncbi:pilus assembly protein [Cupriavidus necator]|uniref:Pilus assembly protein n=1 Tax=Cupriavidus necator TaxID=106590 RepID=A0A1U9UKA9_CUPNE|nr:Flp family type IVb pilin [Cupriavidus necator]AQV93078.1 pilus assembly protein [Cupriavidus necator]
MPGINAQWMKLQRDECGVTSIEYALIAVLIAMAILGGVSALGGSVGSLYNMIASKMPSLP